VELRPASPPEAFRDSLARSYDAAAASRDEMGEAEWRWPIAEAFLARLREAEGSRLLEVGSGVGYTSVWFAERGIDVVATDLSPEQVALCRTKGIEAHVRDMYDLDFPEKSFDALWAMNCVHHVPAADMSSVLDGFADVLVPGGLLYIGVWGGRDEEGIYDDDFYPPPRFFSLRSDATLRSVMGNRFAILEFDTFVPDMDKHDDGLHMQSIVAVRRG